MKVSLYDVKNILDELIQKKTTREEVAHWAAEKQEANDRDDLEFEPSEEKKKIWKAIIFLLGCDLKDIDGTYLHSVDNLIEFRNKYEI